MEIFSAVLYVSRTGTEIKNDKNLLKYYYDIYNMTNLTTNIVK